MAKLAKSKRTDVASNRVCVMATFQDTIYLHAHCSCSHEDHQQTLEISIDHPYDDYPYDDINLLIYSKICTPYTHKCASDAPILEKLECIYKDWKKRLSWIFSIIFKGYVQAESVFSLHGDKQIEDYIDAISRAKNQLWLHAHAKDKSI